MSYEMNKYIEICENTKTNHIPLLNNELFIYIQYIWITDNIFVNACLYIIFISTILEQFSINYWKNQQIKYRAPFLYVSIK